MDGLVGSKGEELLQGKFLSLRNVITVLCCESGNASTNIPAGVKNNTYFVCQSSSLDEEFKDDCLWSAGSPIHRSLYVCLENNVLKRVGFKDGLYVFAESSGGEKRYIPLSPQPLHESIVEIFSRTFCHLSYSDYKKRITWINKLPRCIWPEVPKYACIEYMGVYPGSHQNTNVLPLPSYNEKEKMLDNNTPKSEKFVQFYFKTDTGNAESTRCNVVGSSDKSDFVNEAILDDQNVPLVPVTKLKKRKRRPPQILQYDSGSRDLGVLKVSTELNTSVGEANTDDGWSSLQVYTSFSSDLPDQTLVPVMQLEGKEKKNDSRYKIDIERAYADILSKQSSDRLKCETSSKACDTSDLIGLCETSSKACDTSDLIGLDTSVLGTCASVGKVKEGCVEFGSLLPDGQYLDLKEILIALFTIDPCDRIPQSEKNNIFFVIKKSCSLDLDNSSLSQLYEDEFTWKSSPQVMEFFCCDENNELEEVILKAGMYCYKDNGHTPMNPQPSYDDIIEVERYYGETEIPCPLKKRITSINKIPSHRWPAVPDAVCVEYTVGREDLKTVLGVECQAKEDPHPVEKLIESVNITCIPKEIMKFGLPLPQGNFLDIETLLTGLTSGNTVSHIPKGPKRDVYFICSEMSFVYCNETQKCNVKVDLDECGPWSENATISLYFVMNDELSRYERCYLREGLYYRQKPTANGLIFEVLKPQPSLNSILAVERNQSTNSSNNLWRRISWIRKAPDTVCSDIPCTFCVEYLVLGAIDENHRATESPAQIGTGTGTSSLSKIESTVQSPLLLSEGTPLPGRKWLSKAKLIFTLRSTFPVEHYPKRTKPNEYYVIDVECVEDLIKDSSWLNGKLMRHYYFYHPTLKKYVSFFKDGDTYYWKRKPMVPQPPLGTVLEVMQHISSWKESMNVKRRITYLKHDRVCSFSKETACIEYLGGRKRTLDSGTVVDKDCQGPVCLESGKGKKFYSKTSTINSDMNESNSLVMDSIVRKSACEVDQRSTAFVDRGPSENHPHLYRDVRMHPFVRHCDFIDNQVLSLILYTDEQILNMCHFCSSSTSPSVLSIKTVLEQKGINVTVMAYANCSVIDRSTGCHPIFIGPILFHKDTGNGTYNAFFSHILRKYFAVGQNVRGFRKNGEGLCSPIVVGSDFITTHRESIANNFLESAKLICMEDIREKFNKYLENVHEKTLEDWSEAFFGSEGILSSLDENQLEIRFEKVKQNGKVPEEVLQYFEHFVMPSVEVNFSTLQTHQWINPSWTNKLENMKLNLSGIIEKCESEATYFHLLVEQFYEVVDKQFIDLWDAFLCNCNTITVSEVYSKFSYNKANWSRLTEQQQQSKILGFLGAKESAESVVYKNMVLLTRYLRRNLDNHGPLEEQLSSNSTPKSPIKIVETTMYASTMIKAGMKDKSSSAAFENSALGDTCEQELKQGNVSLGKVAQLPPNEKRLKKSPRIKGRKREKLNFKSPSGKHKILSLDKVPQLLGEDLNKSPPKGRKRKGNSKAQLPQEHESGVSVSGGELLKRSSVKGIFSSDSTFKNNLVNKPVKRRSDGAVLSKIRKQISVKKRKRHLSEVRDFEQVYGLKKACIKLERLSEATIIASLNGKGTVPK